MIPFNSNNKRPRQDSPLSAYSSPEPNFPSPHSYHAGPTSTPGGGMGGGSSASSFRNVSACNRCRLRKNRCDQKLPACTSCEKAKVKCVGIDPITKREIPRAYVYYLENRVSYLEDLLSTHGIQFAPPEDFDVGAPKSDVRATESPPRSEPGKSAAPEKTQKQQEDEKINKLVNNVSMVSVQGASDNRYLGSTSGISFARVVFAAVRSSISGSNAGIRTSNGKVYGPPAVAGTTMRDSFFGLQSKPKFKKAPFPDKELGTHLAYLYFEYANPQTPILHRGDFMALLDRTYALEEKKRSPRELYMLNIVYAIGAGVIYGENRDTGVPQTNRRSPSPSAKRLKVASEQHQPEEYHAAAMVHLEYFLSATPTAERPEGFGGSLEELQAVLLLASFALLRPVAPGLWYIIGVAVRLAVDLGLHYEDGTGIEETVRIGSEIARGQDVVIQAAGALPNPVEPKEKGRREWVRDLRRRLWWCVYSFDRLVSTCVGRPLGITDQVITTEFPSILDDAFITKSGFNAPAGAEDGPSYKRISYHFFRYRLLQSEILQVLQHRQAKKARLRGQKHLDKYMHTDMTSPFLEKFDSYSQWRRDVDQRLWDWVESAPTESQVASKYDTLFFELNYWQAIIMLYRQSLTAPVELNEGTPIDEVMSSPDDRTDSGEDDEIFMKVATAGQKVLKIYYQLHREHVVSYTFLNTHHLFMAGIAFLYAIWHSVSVRSCLTVDDVDYTVLAATTVLSSLTEKCPPAETCREAFERMARATVNMVLRDSGFGSRAPLLDIPQPKRPRSASPHDRTESNISLSQFESKPGQQAYISTSSGERVPAYRAAAGRFQLDPNIRDLFPEDTPETQRFRTVRWGTGNNKTTKNGVQTINRDPPHHKPTPMHSPASPAMSVDTNGPPTGDPSNPSSSSSSKESVQAPYSRDTRATTHQTTTSNSSVAMPGTPNSFSTYNLDNNTPTTPMGPAAMLHTAHSHLLHPQPTSYHNGIALSSLAEPGYHSQAQGMAPDLAAYNAELDYLLGEQASAVPLSGAYMATTGLSLGFNIEDHDWNESTGPDLLDGYWFRPGWGHGGSLSGASGLNALVPHNSNGDMNMNMGMMGGGWAMAAGGPSAQMQQDNWGQQGENLMPPPQHHPQQMQQLHQQQQQGIYQQQQNMQDHDHGHGHGGHGQHHGMTGWDRTK